MMNREKASGRRCRAKSGESAPALIQRHVRVTSTMDAEVLAFGQTEGKADLAEAYRAIIYRGLQHYRAEVSPPPRVAA